MATRQSSRGNAPAHLYIAEYWQPREPRFAISLDEPSCFACCYPPLWVRRTDDQQDLGLTPTQLWAAAKGLERAHLQPHMRGGKNVVENMVMLCAECHKEAPDYIDPEFMLKWMRDRQEWSTAVFAQALELVGTYDIDVTVAAEVACRSGFKDFIRARSGYQTSAGRSGLVSTYMAALADYTALRKYFAAPPSPRRLVRRRSAA